jgi:hypothetical protein
MRQALEHLADDPSGITGAKRIVTGEQLLQGPPLEELHDDVACAVVDSRVEYADHARMGQTGRGHGFAPEPFEDLRFPGQPLVQDLHGYFSP